MSDKRNLKKSFLVRSKILGLLVNTLAADDECSRRNRENLLLPTPMKLFKKPKKQIKGPVSENPLAVNVLK